MRLDEFEQLVHAGVAAQGDFKKMEVYLMQRRMSLEYGSEVDKVALAEAVFLGRYGASTGMEAGDFMMGTKEDVPHLSEGS